MWASYDVRTGQRTQSKSEEGEQAEPGTLLSPDGKRVLEFQYRTSQASERDADTETLRVFIFAGQSNKVGSDSQVQDIKRFPPLAGLELPQDKVLFSYNIGREEKQISKG